MASAAPFDISSERHDLNQYWYSPASIAAMVSEIEMHATKAAFLSTPSLFFSLTNATLRGNSAVFEFDRQWDKDPGFVFYDFNFPERIPIQLMGQFDYVIVDPPFITREVWSKYMATVKLLLTPKGGKVLFSSILENHAMLEGLLDAPLWVPRFRPSIPHLTYQYHLFLNYMNCMLEVENTELPAEDPKIRAALRMANDLRESETQFAAQMQNRNRAGEQLLPAEQPEGSAGSREEEPVGGGVGGRRVMKWTRVPEGLTMYANGADAPPPAMEGADDAATFGPVYVGLVAYRNELETFKKGIDQSQRHLDKLLKLKAASKATPSDAAVAAAGGANVSSGGGEADGGSAACRAESAARLALLDSMDATIAALQAAPASAPDTSLLRTMAECVAEYRQIPLVRDRLQELAADATRKFKSPVFNRQKELLQEMKKAKAEYTAAAAASAAAQKE